MKTLTVYGVGDGRIMAEGLPGCPVRIGLGGYCVQRRGPYSGTLRISSHQGTMDVHALYTGVWSFALSRSFLRDPLGQGIESEDGVLDWPTWATWSTWLDRFTQRLEIECPDSASVEVLDLEAGEGA